MDLAVLSSLLASVELNFIKSVGLGYVIFVWKQLVYHPLKTKVTVNFQLEFVEFSVAEEYFLCTTLFERLVKWM